MPGGRRGDRSVVPVVDAERGSERVGERLEVSQHPRELWRPQQLSLSATCFRSGLVGLNTSAWLLRTYYARPCVIWGVRRRGPLRQMFPRKQESVLLQRQRGPGGPGRLSPKAHPGQGMTGCPGWGAVRSRRGDVGRVTSWEAGVRLASPVGRGEGPLLPSEH